MLGFQHHDSQFQKSKSTLMLNSELNTLLLSLYRTTSWNLHHKGTSESWTSVGINWKKVNSKHTGMEAAQQIQTLRGRIHHTYIGLHWLMQKFTLISFFLMTNDAILMEEETILRTLWGWPQKVHSVDSEDSVWTLVDSTEEEIIRVPFLRTWKSASWRHTFDHGGSARLGWKSQLWMMSSTLKSSFGAGTTPVLYSLSHPIPIQFVSIPFVDL